MWRRTFPISGRTTTACSKSSKTSSAMRSSSPSLADKSRLSRGGARRRGPVLGGRYGKRNRELSSASRVRSVLAGTAGQASRRGSGSCHRQGHRRGPWRPSSGSRARPVRAARSSSPFQWWHQEPHRATARRHCMTRDERSKFASRLIGNHTTARRGYRSGYALDPEALRQESTSRSYASRRSDAAAFAMASNNRASGNGFRRYATQPKSKHCSRTLSSSVLLIKMIGSLKPAAESSRARSRPNVSPRLISISTHVASVVAAVLRNSAADANRTGRCPTTDNSRARALRTLGSSSTTAMVCSRIVISRSSFRISNSTSGIRRLCFNLPRRGERRPANGKLSAHEESVDVPLVQANTKARGLGARSVVAHKSLLDD